MNFTMEELGYVDAVRQKDMNDVEKVQMGKIAEERKKNVSKTWASASGATFAGIASLALVTNPIGWAALAVGGALGVRAYMSAKKVDESLGQEISLKKRVLDRREAEFPQTKPDFKSAASQAYGP